MDIDPTLHGRFVVLFHSGIEDAEHRTANDHWDLMFECGEVLLSWAVEEMPSRGKLLNAIRLTDHRLAYLEYEGPISGNRGSVSRVLSGVYRMLNRDDSWQAASLSMMVNFDDQEWRFDFSHEEGNRWTLKIC